MRGLIITFLILYFLYKIFKRNVVINNYHYNPNIPNQKREKEGKIKVEKIKQDKKGFDKGKLGDFVDYEEIK